MNTDERAGQDAARPVRRTRYTRECEESEAVDGRGLTKSGSFVERAMQSGPCR